MDDGGDLTHVLARRHPGIARMLKGVVEEDLTGVHRLYQLAKAEKVRRSRFRLKRQLWQMKRLLLQFW